MVISLRPKQSSLAREDPDVAPQASKEVDRCNHLKRLPFTKNDSRPAPQVSKKGRLVPEQRRPPGIRVEDFVPWVAPISSLPLDSEEEEEEDEMADLIHNFGVRKCKRGASFNRTTDVTPEAMGEADQHSTGGGSEERAIVVMDLLEMGFHGQPTMETTHLSDLEEVPLIHEEARGVFLWSKLLARQPKPCRPGPGAVGRCFLTGCYYILIFLHRAKLPLWRKYQLLGPKEPRKLSNAGSHLTRVNPRPPIWSNRTQQCFGCLLRCELRGGVKNMPFRFLPTLVRKISSRRSKMTC